MMIFFFFVDHRCDSLQQTSQWKWFVFIEKNEGARFELNERCWYEALSKGASSVICLELALAALARLLPGSQAGSLSPGGLWVGGGFWGVVVRWCLCEREWSLRVLKVTWGAGSRTTSVVWSSKAEASPPTQMCERGGGCAVLALMDLCMKCVLYTLLGEPVQVQESCIIFSLQQRSSAHIFKLHSWSLKIYC